MSLVLNEGIEQTFCFTIPMALQPLAALSASHKYCPLSCKLATSTMVLSVMLLGQNREKKQDLRFQRQRQQPRCSGVMQSTESVTLDTHR